MVSCYDVCPLCNFPQCKTDEMLIYPYVVQVFITQNGGDINTDDDGDSTDDTPNGT